ncbi:MAG TPA: tetratricopeptide repeat protein, partial [Candidatus Binatus sp.]|nr:tetratricopeptide repeat protein [Candidatus Binatus sp.]
MARPLFEQYKDALRRGHVALLGDELETALAAYEEAAALVPDRPLPYASMGAVLARLGRHDDALAAVDRALAIAPDDEASIRARDALLQDRASAASVAPEVDPAAAQP